MKPIPGMYLDEPNEVYHANKEYNSFSNLKLLIESPELYKKYLDGLLPNEHKDAWDIGNAVHAAVLEPHKLGEYYFADESYNGATKDGKEIKADCVERGITLLNASNSAVYHKCVGAIYESPAIRLFQSGDPEVTFRVGGKNLKLQCRTDWICHEAPAGLEAFGINEGERYIADLKTTQSVSHWQSSREYRNPLTNELLYAGQEYLYRSIIDGILNDAGKGRVDHWLFVVVEKKEPFRVRVIRSPENAMSYAQSIVNQTLIDLVERKKSGNWKAADADTVFEPDIRIYN